MTSAETEAERWVPWSALVVISAGCYPDLVFDDLVDKAMLIGDAA
jgi:hypothetical protein